MNAVCKILVIVGLLIVILGILVWLNVIKPGQLNADEQNQKKGFWDFVLALLDRAPWPIAVGVVIAGMGFALCYRASNPKPGPKP
jgi:hypothetical protein